MIFHANCLLCQNLFTGEKKNDKNIQNVVCWYFFHSMLSIKKEEVEAKCENYTKFCCAVCEKGPLAIGQQFRPGLSCSGLQNQWIL